MTAADAKRSRWRRALPTIIWLVAAGFAIGALLALA